MYGVGDDMLLLFTVYSALKTEVPGIVDLSFFCFVFVSLEHSLHTSPIWFHVTLLSSLILGLNLHLP